MPTTLTQTMTSAEQVLTGKSLRITRPRLDILASMLSHGSALGQQEIEHRLGPGVDRVTVYRTLRTFVTEGILHAIPDEEFGVRYALCDEHACEPNGHHHHDHVHFKCTRCGDTLCLDDVRLPALPLPAGYQTQELTVLAKGICQTCASA